MSDQYLGEIRIFPFNFAPYGWAQCQGQILSITQNTALFSLLGTLYGGNGTSTFGLPNFQGSVMIGQGQGNGLSLYNVGEDGGTSTVTLPQTQMPMHTHPFTADDEVATTANPSGAYYMKGHYKVGTTNGAVGAYTTVATNATMSSSMVGVIGGSQAHNNMMPYLALNFCIALQGAFPQRS
jgi:microcystin-dependent protein